MKAGVFGVEMPSGGGLSGAPSQQTAGAGSPSLPMLPEQPDCGAPCALCESYAHMLAKAREEIKEVFEYEAEMDELRADNAALREENDNLRAGTMHTCHDKCQRPLCVANRRIRELEAELAALRAALEDLLSCQFTVVPSTVPIAGEDAAPSQVVYIAHVALPRLRRARAALEEGGAK